MNALMIALTMSLAGTEGTFDGPGRLALDLPLRMSLFDVEATVEASEVPAASFPALIVAFDLPSYAELQGGVAPAASVALDALETRPWLVATPAPTEGSSMSWLKDWTQR